MADTTGNASHPLIKDLISLGHEFSFEQVMCLARVILGEERVPELPGSWLLNLALLESVR